VIDLDFARQVLAGEGRVIAGLAGRIGEDFERAVHEVINCTEKRRGRVVVTGMGKAGIIGQKIAATFSSTGTPALFLHPAEALHGDIGAVQAEDLVLALSNSGETEEVVRLLEVVKKIGANIVAITSSSQCTLGRHSDIVLELGRIEEVCPLGLAPSASTAAMLAVGDALALTALKTRGFTADDYRRYHPAGELGRQAVKLLTVGSLMRTGERCPTAAPGMPLLEVLAAMTKPRAGAACVVDAGGKLLGLFTDGDFRRHYSRAKMDVSAAPVEKYMTADPCTVGPDRLAVEALALMRERQFDELPVVDTEGRLVGLLDVQDLLAAGLV
jgi:arabinose-5-phosphate isomerase